MLSCTGNKFFHSIAKEELTMNRLMALVAFLILGLLALIPPAQAASYTFTSLNNYPGASSTVPTGINDNGQIVGFYAVSGGSGGSFLYSNSTYTSVNIQGATNTNGYYYVEASGINNAGLIVGTYYNGSYCGFVYNSSSYSYISLPGTDVFAQGINDSGEVVGTIGQSVGFLLIGSAYTYFSPPNAATSAALGINHQGEIVGEYWDKNSNYLQHYQYGFLYNNGAYTSLSYPGALWTSAFGINSSGQIVGQYSLNPYNDPTRQGDSNLHGFLYYNGTFTSIDAPNAVSTQPYGINDQGQIVGYCVDDMGPHGFVASPYEEVTIDIEPWFKPNIIDIMLKWVPIPVAILSTSTFNAPKSIEWDSLTFGHSGNEKSLVFCCQLPVDVNGDKAPDLICFFNTGEAEFQCGDTQGILKGQTMDGTPIEGSDSVKIVPCK